MICYVSSVMLNLVIDLVGLRKQGLGVSYDTVHIFVIGSKTLPHEQLC